MQVLSLQAPRPEQSFGHGLCAGIANTTKHMPSVICRIQTIDYFELQTLPAFKLTVSSTFRTCVPAQREHKSRPIDRIEM
eukprot:8746624-Pyramimonas_sp.AAC.1